MNRYPVWKFVLMVVAVLVGLLYTVPNLYGEAPAVQVSAAKLTTKVGPDTVTQVEQLLAAASIKADYVAFEGTSVHARFATTDTQIHARDVLAAGLNAQRRPGRRALRRLAEPRAARAALDGIAARAADVPRAWTCAAACTSCCRST